MNHQRLVSRKHLGQERTFTHFCVLAKMKINWISLLIYMFYHLFLDKKRINLPASLLKNLVAGGRILHQTRQLLRNNEYSHLKAERKLARSLKTVTNCFLNAPPYALSRKGRDALPVFRSLLLRLAVYNFINNKQIVAAETAKNSPMITIFPNSL